MVETFVDAQSEHSHSPSQHSDYSGNSNQCRRRSIEISDGPLYPGLNTEPEDCANSVDSDDDLQVFFHSPRRDHRRFISSDDEDEDEADVSLLSLSC